MLSSSLSSSNNNYPTATTIPFPYSQPYPQQAALMNALLEGIRNNAVGGKLMVLESPTGTGKSLSLACAALAWLDYHKHQKQHQQQQQRLRQDHPSSQTSSTTSPTTTTTTTTTTSRSWLDEYQAPDDSKAEREKMLQQEQQEDQRRQTALAQYLQNIRSTTTPSNLEQRENTLRQAMSKAQILARKEQRQKKQQRKQQRALAPPKLNYESSSSSSSHEEEESSYRTKPPLAIGSPEWMLAPAISSLPPYSSPSQRQVVAKRIIYAARTHSQLSQFIGEVQRTHWGPTTQVVALGSRSQGLCGYLTSNSNTTKKNRHKPMSESQFTEQCHDLRNASSKTAEASHKADVNGKRKSSGSNTTSTCACPYYQSSHIATLAVHSLAQPTDIEEMIALGKATQTCAYYATRKALPRADLIVLPYTMLVDAKTRDAIGITRTVLQESLVLIDEAHNLPSAIQNVTSAQISIAILQRSQEQLQGYTQKYLQQLSPLHMKWLGQLKVVVRGLLKAVMTQKGTTTTATTTTNSTTNTTKELQSISEFLCTYKLESINLFPILRYMHDSKLSQKLLGFLPPKPKEEGEKDTSTAMTLSSHISPMSVVEDFLKKLNTFDPQHAKMVVDREAAQLQLVVLNPAVHAQDDLYTQPHAVCLVGGTLQPFTVLVQELVPSLAPQAAQAQAKIQQGLSSSSSSAGGNHQTFVTYHSDRLVGFSCGHVVSSDQVLLQNLKTVGKVTLDLRHASRGQSSILHAIGHALMSLCREVPHGVVVFFPSYRYEQLVVEAWKTMKTVSSGETTTIWKALHRIKPIFREPKQRIEMEKTLADYSKTAQATRTGALLLAVVGGKLSEGINFANDLCRCVVVVGLPYADKSDPILQEKLKYTSNSAEYYQSLCLRAVNQSVGRAIRHAKDYAAVVVMDPRYSSNEGIAKGLPQWLTASTPNWRRREGSLQSVTDNLSQFFANPGFVK